MACFSHCKAYTITFDSEDSLIDSYIPADYFYIAHGESRLSAIKKLIKTTGCKAIIKADGAVHIFVPTNHKPSDRRPAIVFFFGGGWNSGSPRQFYPHCEYFASRGMVAISAEYRTKRRGGVQPSECVKDGKAAIRYVRKHAKEAEKIAKRGGN